jgi:hypothetical protein
MKKHECHIHGTFYSDISKKCPVCSKNVPENEYNIKEKDIIVMAQTFDVFIPALNIAVESDEIHHFFPIFGDEQFKLMKKIDDLKNKYALLNKIKVIRVPYILLDDIDGIMEKEVSFGKYDEQRGVIKDYNKLPLSVHVKY